MQVDVMLPKSAKQSVTFELRGAESGKGEDMYARIDGLIGRVNRQAIQCAETGKCAQIHPPSRFPQKDRDLNAIRNSAHALSKEDFFFLKVLLLHPHSWSPAKMMCVPKYNSAFLIGDLYVFLGFNCCHALFYKDQSSVQGQLFDPVRQEIYRLIKQTLPEFWHKDTKDQRKFDADDVQEHAARVCADSKRVTEALISVKPACPQAGVLAGQEE